MKRFRFTLLAVFLLPFCLGIIDLRLVLTNTSPHTLSASALATSGLPQEWVVIENATLDLTRAINLSGELPIEVLFVPLMGQADDRYRIWIETREPALVDLISRYETGFDTVFAKEAFFDENRERFYPTRTLDAMAADWISANPNKENLLQLLNNDVTGPDREAFKERMILLSANKAPSPVRGSFYLFTGIVGLALVLRRWQKDARKHIAEKGETP